MSVRRSIVLGFAIALLLAGCQGEPEPRVEPTPSESSSVTDASEQPEPQTAEEFVRAWVELHTEMQNTGETDEFRAVSQDCQACIELAELVESYYKAGGYVQTQGWTIQSLKQRSDSGKVSEFEANIASGATTYVERAGGPEERLPAGRGTELFVVRQVDDRWQMIAIAEIAQ